MTKTLKVGLLGLGGIAQYHVPGWQESEHAELVAGSDVRPEVFASWKERFGVATFYERAADLIADPEIDIIDICTPNMFHTEQVVAALEAGKHVICEKPLAPTPADIRKMIAARDHSRTRDGAPVLLMTAQHFRFHGNSQAIKSEIEHGALGDVYHARAWWLRRSGVPVGPTFIYKNRSGGGPCIDLGVHVLDLTLWLMGHPRPLSVSGAARIGLAHHDGAFSAWGRTPIPKEMDVEDFATAFVRFDTGATLILETSWMLHHPEEDIRVWVYGTEGGCQWPGAEFHTTNYVTRQLNDSRLKLTEDSLEPHALECVEFARAVAEGRPSPVPPEQSLQVQAILDGIYRSQVEGKEVSLVS